ncbi:LamG domain-containing protein [Azospirillum sp.]|uniref:LamG domain-containing protein n=1 Tax=Azospirillum sp. TaxID=34012 RepID=UPI0026064675|nr:LamG domain-containing protein [Azospirillum sp.]
MSAAGEPQGPVVTAGIAAPTGEGGSTGTVPGDVDRRLKAAADIAAAEAACGPLLSRSVYSDGQFLTADDFGAEQDWHRSRLEWVLRRLVRPGRLSGLGVTAGKDAAGTLCLFVEPGVAVDDRGRLVIAVGRAELKPAPSPGTPSPAAVRLGLKDGRFSIPVSDPHHYGMDGPRAWTLSLSFREEAEAAAEHRVKQVPAFALRADPGAVPAQAVALARVVITATARTPQPELSATVEPAAPAGVDPSVLPAIGALEGHLAADRITGTLRSEQIPALPLGKFDGSLDAARVTGTLRPEQIPALPLGKFDGSLDATRIAGTLKPEQIPDLPVTKIVGLGPMPSGAVPDDLKRRLALLERRVYPQVLLAIPLGRFAHANHIAAYEFGAADMSVAAIFRTTTSGTLVSSKSTEGGSSTRAGWLLTVGNGGVLKFATDSGFTFSQVVTGPTAARDGQIHGIVAVRRGGALEVFLDGTRLSTFAGGAGSTMTLSGTNRLVIGSCDQDPEPNRHFDGGIREVSLWKRALDVAEIAALLGEPPSSSAAGLVGLWGVGDNPLEDRTAFRNTMTCDPMLPWA